MKNNSQWITRTGRQQVWLPILAGLLVGLLAFGATVSAGMASPHSQSSNPTPQGTVGDGKACKDCHLDIETEWVNSPHANAFKDQNFIATWKGAGEPGECLICHTTNYQASTGQYDAEGVACEACHGVVDPNHPPATVPIRADTQYCGSCHTTTLGEWRLTAHSTNNVGCADCHNPHSQQPLFENPDEMCINCHKDTMGDYLKDMHGQKGIGCVDCHALVIPPSEPPVDGIVPTGHTFTISAKTCVACHTDALHSGFSLPGFEQGASAAIINAATEATPEASSFEEASLAVQSPQEQIQSLTSKVEILSAANANRNMTTLFQGGIVGLALGGSTAWLIANNIRRGRKEEPAEDAHSEEKAE